MKLSPRQVELLRSTFSLLEPKSRVVALAYFQRLFSLDPSLRQRWSGDLETESDRLIELLRAATEFADRPPMLRDVMARQIHNSPSFGPGGEHHALTGEALLWALSTTLGRESTPEAHAAWAALHEVLAESFRASQQRPQ